MKIKFEINITTLLLMVGVVVFFLLWRYEAKDSLLWRGNYNAVSTEMQNYQSSTDGVIVAYRESIRLTESELKKTLKSDSIQRELVKHYRKLASSTTIITEWKHDTIKVDVPIFIDRDTVIPFVDPCFTADFQFANRKFSMNNISINNRQDILEGDRKAGLFKTVYSIDVRNTNPCLKVTGVTNYTVVRKKRWWENPVTWGVVGLVGGYILNDYVIK